jgi:hypothetical protein
MPVAEARRFSIGTHELVFEPPDLLVMILHGLILEEQVARYGELRASLVEGQNHVLILLDLRDYTEMSPGSRKAMADIVESRPQATACIGASFRFRVLADMVATASRFFGRTRTTVGFFANEAAARAWLGEMRRKFRESGAP